jgi:serine/threonine protein kinase
MIGQRIAQYEVTGKLGAGGMGEVYRARDTRLDRDVALKILPEAFAADPDRLMRFTREAKTLASLNHPNIAGIYGIEEASAAGRHALAMELVEGEDLSDRIARGPMPTDEAVAIAKQIADALAAAHDAGIIHRDLKPANVKVRADGAVKVLDFGLAKAVAGADSGTQGSAAQSPTITSPALTAMGLILGTAAYMSPEQAKGRPVDRRADIWAFGVILHEMLTGRRLFEAEDVSETLAAVLTRDVSAAATLAHVPPGLRTIISDCLVRDPKKRLRDIGDVRLMLDKFERADDASIPPSPASSRALRLLWPALASLAVVAALGVSALYFNQEASPAPEPIAFELSAPDLSRVHSISPDGRQLIYGSIATDGRPARLWLRPLGSLDASPIPGTDGLPIRARSPRRPVWSPDSRAVVVSSVGGLMRIDLVSGQRAPLIERARHVFEPGGWNRDGAILVGVRSDAGGGIGRLADSGGALTPVTQILSAEYFHRPSGFLPDGRRFLYYVESLALEAGGDVRVGSIEKAPADQDSTALFRADGPAVYASGHVLFVSSGTLLAQPFDAARAATAGPPVPLASNVDPYISVSDNGRLVYRQGGSDAALEVSEVLRFDRSGRTLSHIGPPSLIGDVNALDGNRVAVTRTDGGVQHIHIADLARATFSRLNPGDRADYASAPSRDGMIAYTSSPDGIPRDLYVRAANGVGDPRLLVSSSNVKHANGWSPDGRFLIYDDHSLNAAQDLYIVRREGGTPIRFLVTPADETLARFSPDGQWVVYSSTESGRFEIYVRDFAPDKSPAYGSEKIQISPDGGAKPRWSPNGREIFFFQGSTLMSVPVTPGRPFRAGKAVALFDARPTSYIPYDVMPDGTFVIANRIESRATGASPLRVLLNWQAALRK